MRTFIIFNILIILLLLAKLFTFQYHFKPALDTLEKPKTERAFVSNETLADVEKMNNAEDLRAFSQFCLQGYNKLSQLDATALQHMETTILSLYNKIIRNELVAIILIICNFLIALLAIRQAKSQNSSNKSLNRTA